MIMDESSNISSPSSGSDCLPMTPVSENESTSPSPSLDTAPPAISIPERKLTIRVPVEYIPPTPPPSASLPAIPPHRQSLAPVADAHSKRASAPVSSWTASKALDETTTLEAPAPSKASVVANVPKVIKSAPHNVPVGVADGETKVPKMILMSPSHSVLHVPTAAKEMKQSTPEKPARYGAELLPTSTPSATPGWSRPRRKSTPGQPKTTLEPPPVTIRKSSSIGNSPVYVSHIDFGSSSEDEEDENENEPHSPSVPDEGHVQRPSHARMVSDESDLSHWAPEPAYFPNQSTSVSYSVNPPPAPGTQWSTRSRSSASRSLSSKDREGSLVGSASPRRRPPAPREPHTHTLLTERVQRDVDFAVRALVSPEMFADMLSDPLARHRFREFLVSDGNTGTAELDFWTDAQFLAQSIEQLRANGLAFRDLYVSNSGEAHVLLPPEVRRDLLGALQHVIAADASLGSTQARLLESMYNDQFQRFIKHKIIQETHLTLGRANLTSQEGAGLGDAFILTNPRLPDHPIVLVSDGFVDVTGYSRAEIIGRNCRFLQGPGTSPESVRRIRDGLNSGKGCTELLLNYRRNGEPFYCLLCITPVRDTSGTIVYFIGGQTNVTGLLATDKGLGLHGANASDDAPQPIQMSPVLALLLGHAPAATDSGARTHGTAGAVAQPRPAHGSGFFRGLFGRSGGQAETGTVRPDGRQVIASAEATMNVPSTRGLQDQYALSQNMYNKILIFKFTKREITFVSPQMLAFLGLPIRTQRDLDSSPLIRNDIVRLVTAGDDRNETRRLREKLKNNIRRGTPCLMHCAVKIPGKGILTRTDSARYKFGMMHMTPIKDGDDVAVAFVAIFG
ncbi:hypothetical protein MVEN_02193000 [Mycena venus]|uniref:PAS domain-containing protein n=1 Tax=Mycena venus TaxID=2733690 RepID=A0A8H6X6F0_9AGAR|nr:hypothetical protein MVEN_02193000 [Mycena venus]